MIDRVHRELTAADIAKIADTYHAWRGDPVGADLRVHPGQTHRSAPTPTPMEYADIPGFCKSATLADIRGHGHILTPGRYVGAAEVEDDDEPFEDKMARLTAQLETQFAESAKLEAQIRENLRWLEGA